MGEVPVDLPVLPEVVGSFDQHGRRPERFERYYHVGEVELGFQVQLDVHVFLAILRLPPGFLIGSV